MKRLLTSLFLLLILVTPIYAQADLTQTIISEETGLIFSLPEDWTAKFNSGGRSSLILESSDIQLEVFSPATLIGDRLDHAQKAKELLASIMELYEWDIGDFETQTIGDQTLTIGNYQLGNFDGILVGIPLGNNEYAIIDTIDWAKSRDTDLIIKIASTFERLSPLVLENHAGPWQSAVNELQNEGIIGVGGGIVFVEDRAFFSGKGLFFTPLASNSPQTNFVMAATLNYHVGQKAVADESSETCTLLARLQTDSSTGIVSHFLEFGFDNWGAFYYSTLKDNRITNYGEFSRIQLNETYHVMVVVSGETLSLFLDGVQIATNLPIDESAGTFGIALRGYGATAECVGNNIWVYRIPEVQEGVCRATASGNVNKRSGPSTSNDIPGQLQASSSVHIIGKVVGEDGFVWWQLEDETWVRNDVIQLLGDCRDVPTLTGDI
jgi:hypothetical protein